MKKYFKALLFLIIAMAIIPIAANNNSFKNIFLENHSKSTDNSFIVTSKDSRYNMPENLTFTNTSTGKQTSRSTKSLIYSLVGAAVDVDFLEDEVKALSIAFHTQLCHENDLQTLVIDTNDDNIFLSVNNLKSKFGNSYTTLCSYCDNVYSLLILASDKPADLKIEYLKAALETNDTVTYKAIPYTSLSNDYSVTTAFEKDEFFNALKKLNPNIDTNISPQQAVGKITYYDSGEVDIVNICGKDFSGSDIAAAFSLPYRRFTLIYSLGKFRFNSLRCDVSNHLTPDAARFMALQGNTYEEILSYFYMK